PFRPILRMGKAFPFPGGLVVLKSAARAIARRWQIAAVVAGAVFLIGLLFIPRPFSYTAYARLLAVADRWNAGRLQDFAQSDLVLDHAAKSLGYEHGSELRPGLSTRIEAGAMRLSVTPATRARAIELPNAISK